MDKRLLDPIPATLTKEIPNLQSLELYLQRKGRSTRTIKVYIKELTQLAKRADLQNPAEVELAIATYKKKNKQPATNAYKAKLVSTYATYCNHFNIKWEDKPKYTREEKSRFNRTFYT